MASHGFDVICSDVKNPAQQADELHKPYRDQFKIEYREVNALSMPFGDNTFDVVMFKSFLGYLSQSDQNKAIEEIRRVLKPGGILLFAENLKGSFLHRFIRHYFVSWGRNWNYITMAEVKNMTRAYSSYYYKSAGFLSLFFPNPVLKSLVYPIDVLICSGLPAKLKYVLFGAARK
jgi:ubiquinone/menaquinone biosynthesis C-methylase UbiE